MSTLRVCLLTVTNAVVAFPLTHTTSIVECSAWHICEVVPPVPSSPSSAPERKPKHGRMQDVCLLKSFLRHGIALAETRLNLQA
ncbi:hypothetical protein EDD16DRAFT_1626035 [Pisolithus croceorrhizus]|nr:hypothetical protein EDD16DRAFT_1626035 [Pisolithus croceorrhizus]